MVLTFHPTKFIEEVQARPGLYNHPDHPLDRAERLELWKQVGAALFPDWDTYSKATAYDRVLQLQKKWRSFRDAYNRELRVRRTDPSRTRKVYRYFKRMSFLGGFEGSLSPAEESGEEDDKKFLYPVRELEFKDESYMKSDEDLLTENQNPPTVTKKKKKKRKRESSGSIQAEEEYEMPMPMFSSATDITDNDCDSDRLFLLSFAPEMRQLPVHLKMWARAQIANIMQEAVRNQYNNTMPRTGNSEQSYGKLEINRDGPSE